VLIAILLATELAGILGALLAIPAAGIIQVILRDVWDHRRGAPKAEPTVGEERTPVDAANPDDAARNTDRDDPAGRSPRQAVMSTTFPARRRSGPEL
jgi:hypothetical protein